ncbi:MAG: hypothetical protein OCD01_04855 [Fibrobacterales bacterium]
MIQYMLSILVASFLFQACLATPSETELANDISSSSSSPSNSSSSAEISTIESSEITETSSDTKTKNSSSSIGSDESSDSEGETPLGLIHSDTTKYDPDKPLLDLDKLKMMRIKFREQEPDNYSYKRNTAGFIDDSPLIYNNKGTITLTYNDGLPFEDTTKQYSLDSLFSSLIQEATRIQAHEVYVDSIIIEYDSTYSFPSSIVYKLHIPPGVDVDGIDAIDNTEFTILQYDCPDYAPRPDGWCEDGVVKNGIDENGCDESPYCVYECSTYSKWNCPDSCDIHCVSDCITDSYGQQVCANSCGSQSTRIDKRQ